MNRYAVFIPFLFFCLFTKGSFAQDIKTTTISYNGVKYPAYTKVYDLPENQLLDVLKSTFEGRKAKGKTNKGFLVYRSVKLPGLGFSDLHDVFFKTEKEGKKSDGQSRLYAIVTKPGEIPDDKPGKNETDAASGVVLAAGGYALFEATEPVMENQMHLNSINKNQEDLKKAESKLKALQDQKAQIERDLQKLNTEKSQNQKDMELQAKQVENMRKELEVIKNSKPKSGKTNQLP